MASWTSTNKQLEECSNVVGEVGKLFISFAADIDRSVDLMYKKVI